MSTFFFFQPHLVLVIPTTLSDGEIEGLHVLAHCLSKWHWTVFDSLKCRSVRGCSPSLKLTSRAKCLSKDLPSECRIAGLNGRILNNVLNDRKHLDEVRFKCAAESWTRWVEFRSFRICPVVSSVSDSTCRTAQARQLLLTPIHSKDTKTFRCSDQLWGDKQECSFQMSSDAFTLF